MEDIGQTNGTDKIMKVALVCPASLPATQFGGILFLCVDIAREIAKSGHDVTIYTTDLDFANNAKTFNKKLPRLETVQGFRINRTHVWFSMQLFYVNPGMYYQIKKDRPHIIHTIGVRSFQSFIAALISKNLVFLWWYQIKEALQLTPSFKVI